MIRIYGSLLLQEVLTGDREGERVFMDCGAGGHDFNRI